MLKRLYNYQTLIQQCFLINLLSSKFSIDILVSVSFFRKQLIMNLISD